MGYNLYITRRKDHWDEDGPSITEGEWRTLVEADPELDFRDCNNPLLATWSGESTHPDPWFDYSAEYGSIDTKNPDEPIIAKMLEMAKKLNAKVQGDDGEVYTSPTTYLDEDNETTECESRPWWKRILGIS
jgi:hypothetical protein